MSDVDADPKVIELQTQLKQAEDAIAKENSDFAEAERTGEMEEGAGSAHFATLDAMEGTRRGLEIALKRQRGIVEEARATAAKVVDPETLSDEIRQARERSELAEVELHQPHQWNDHERFEHDRDLAVALVTILIRRQDELAAQPIPGDTGHYDDGHGLGWNKPDELDTGHYDDGHSFGWGTKKKVAVGVGIVAAIVAIVAGAVALTRDGGGGSTPSAASSASVSAPSPSQSSNSLDVVSLPANTVLAGCIAIDPQGNTTILHPGFLVANPQPGEYTATFASGPTGLVTGTGAANGNLVVTDVTITAFGTYDDLTLRAPGGAPVDIGQLASQLPLDINAQTDKPNGCEPTALAMPSSGARTTDADHAAISAFLPRFSQSMQTGDAAFLTSALDPAVLARYGEAQCRSDVGAVATDPTANVVLKGFASGPEPFTYASDGQSTVVPNSYTVAVTRTANGAAQDTTLHLSVDTAGAVHWFTDCTH